MTDRSGQPGIGIDDGRSGVLEVPAERSWTESSHERLDKHLQSLAAGIARLERKLDRLLALSVESHRKR